MTRSTCNYECPQGRRCTCHPGGQPWGTLPLLAALVIVLSAVALVLIVKGVA